MIHPLYFIHVRTIATPTSVRGRIGFYDTLTAKRADILGYTLENADYLFPPGVYPVGLHTWTAINKPRVHIQKVPGRTYILAHEGNRPPDSLGCVLTASGAVAGHFDWIFGSIAGKLADMAREALEAKRPVYWETLDTEPVRRVLAGR